MHLVIVMLAQALPETPNSRPDMALITIVTIMTM